MKKPGKPKFPNKTEFRRSVKQIVLENSIKQHSNDTASTAMLKHTLQVALDDFCRVCPGSEDSLLKEILSLLAQKNFSKHVVDILFDEKPSMDRLQGIAHDMIHFANEQILMSCMFIPFYLK